MSGSNRDFLGVAQPTRECALTPEMVALYVDATDDPNPRYAGENAVAPPMAVVIGTIPHALFPLLQDEAFIGSRQRLIKLLHGEEDIRWHAPLRPNDLMRLTTTVVDLADKSVGELLELVTEVRNAEGDRLATVETGLVIREPKPPEERRRATRPPKPEPALEAEEFGAPIEREWRVAPDQSERYAAASGDENPIHLSDVAAQRAGLKGKILHGLCTMAFAQRTVIEGVLGGEPTGLRRLKVRFSRPVFMGDRLTCTLQPVAVEGHYRVSVHNQDGLLVLRDGVAEVESSS